MIRFEIDRRFRSKNPRNVVGLAGIIIGDAGRNPRMSRSLVLNARCPRQPITYGMYSAYIVLVNYRYHENVTFTQSIVGLTCRMGHKNPVKEYQFWQEQLQDGVLQKKKTNPAKIFASAHPTAREALVHTRAKSRSRTYKEWREGIRCTYARQIHYIMAKVMGDRSYAI